MRFLTKKSTIQKIILALVVVILFNFAIPVRSSANVLEQLLKLVDALRRCCDGIIK